MGAWVMSSTINDRAMLLMTHVAIQGAVPGQLGRNYWERFSQDTGIPAQRWRNVMSRRQKVTLEMLEALTRRHPQHAFWLATGITDVANGHVAPPNAVTFPERTQVDDHWGALYFKAALTLLDRLYQAAGIDTEDDEARLQASVRTRQMAKFDGGPVVDTAYKLAASDDYHNALELWANRERDREKHVGRLRAASESPPAEFGDPLHGGDGRGWHQSPWDMFFKPVPEKGAKKT